MEDGQVSDDTCLQAAKPTVDKLRAGGAKVILLAHFDRPKGKVVPSMSLRPSSRRSPRCWAPSPLGDCAARRADAERYAPHDLCSRTSVSRRRETTTRRRRPAANGDLYVNDASRRPTGRTLRPLGKRLPAHAGERRA
jgi:phosphoglycerate kinase